MIIIIIITIIRNCLEDGIGKYWQLYAAVLRIVLAHSHAHQNTSREVAQMSPRDAGLHLGKHLAH